MSAVPRAPRLAGLDGLRAIAVTAVFLFHADLGWLPGGYLGVDLFFVISGFLITGLVAAEIESRGHLDLPQFYWRRAKRLLPASWLMTALLIGVATLIAQDAQPRLRMDALASLAYFTNWSFLAARTSYFEGMGRQPLLLHFWSLAVEEQFYIFWAPAVMLLLPRLKRGGLAVVSLALAAASALWMAEVERRIGYPGDGNPTRLLFGTDTHGFSLLTGAALGLLWRPGRMSGRSPLAVRALLVIAGLAAFGGLIYLFLNLGEETEWLYPAGFLALALVSAVLITAATHRGLPFGRLLDAQPLRWIGERSYGIYLWHWPIFQLTRPGIDQPAGQAVTLVLRIVLTLGIAALSYHFVEQPIRGGALGRLWRGLNTPGKRVQAFAYGAQFAAALVLTLAVLLAPLYRIPGWPSPEAFVTGLLGTHAKAAEATPAPEPEPPVVYAGEDVTAIGDSVLLGSKPVFVASLKGAQVHATVGWQAADVIKELQTLEAQNALTPVVVVHLGTNGYIYEKQLRTILTLLSGQQRVLLVNTHVPRRWMAPNNALFDRVAPEFPNVVLVDWRGASEGHAEYFVSDGVHLTASGQRAFVTAIATAGHLAAETPPAPKTRPAARPGKPPAVAPQPPGVAAPQAPPVEPVAAQSETSSS